MLKFFSRPLMNKTKDGNELWSSIGIKKGPLSVNHLQIGND